MSIAMMYEQMTYLEVIELKSEVVSGKYINLRIATESDAEFILDLRLNPVLNKFIGATNPSVEKQRAWISSAYQKQNDFHFIIEDKQSNRYGTVAVYNINFKDQTAEWGRWIIRSGSPVYIPIESMILTLFFAFKKLGLKKLTGGANNQNAAVVRFHKNYAGISGEDETHTWFYFEEAHFLKALRLYKQFHNLV